MTTIFVNADWSAIVPAGSPEAAFGVQPRDAKRLGIDKLPVQGGASVPDDLPEPDTLKTLELRSASLHEEPSDAPEAEADTEAKESPAPANKAAAKPANKGGGKDTEDGDGN